MFMDSVLKISWLSWSSILEYLVPRALGSRTDDSALRGCCLEVFESLSLIFDCEYCGSKRRSSSMRIFAAYNSLLRMIILKSTSL
jgi:hypothetical protein